MSIYRRFWRCLPILLVGISALFLFVRARRVQAVQIASFGRYTASQILDKTAFLCRIVAPEASGMLLSADRDVTDTSDGRLRRCWSVECTDVTDRFIACFTWNADTGNLWYVAHRAPKPAQRVGKGMSRQEAVRMAGCWMRSLGIAAQTPRWRLRGEPGREGNIWFVSWQADGRTATLSTDAYTGSLLGATCWWPRAGS